MLGFLPLGLTYEHFHPEPAKTYNITSVDASTFVNVGKAIGLVFSGIMYFVYRNSIFANAASDAIKKAK